MTNTDKAVPAATPWQRNIKPASKYNCVFSGRNEHVLYMATSGMPADKVEANMEFLLKAVNEHEALRRVAEAARACREVMARSMCGDSGLNHQRNAMKAESALSDALKVLENIE